MSLDKKTRKHRKISLQKQTKKKTSSGYIHPGDDFYLHINKQWLQSAKIPPTKSMFGVSEEVEQRIESQMNKLMKESIEVSHSKKNKLSYLDTIESMIGRLATSVITADTANASINTLQAILTNIRSLQNKEEVAVILGEFSRYKIRSLFTIYGQYENKNNSEYTFTIGTGSLGLPDPTYYYSRTLNRGKYFHSYLHMVHKLEQYLQIPNLTCVVRLERLIAGVLMQTDRDTIEYERLGSELAKDFQHIPFSILFETMGLTNWKTRIFYVESLRWLHTLNKLFHHLGLDYWRLLLSLECILFALPWLPPPFSDLSFQFYKKELRGQLQKLPRRQQAIYVLEGYATQPFSRLYVEKILDTSIKPKIIAMVKDFLLFAQKRIETVEWLEPKTRKQAQEKIANMRYSVAYPDSFEHYKYPLLQESNLLSNLLELGQWKTETEIAKLGEPISQKKDWDDAVFVVNAYYYGQVNEIIIPAGILQPPFYDEKRSMAWNYGGLGCILCHEITHAFDKEGKEYNPDGLQKKWWTSTDNRNYNHQTKALIQLYSKQHVNGFPVSGKKTLSENIADIGGMGIALDVLQHKLDEMPLTKEERHQAYRDFFTSYAISWRMKEKKKKRLQSLIMDKHAPAFLRVNMVVSQFKEWYDAFDIKPEDKLYIPPEKRIRIF